MHMHESRELIRTAVWCLGMERRPHLSQAVCVSVRLADCCSFDFLSHFGRGLSPSRPHLMLVAEAESISCGLHARSRPGGLQSGPPVRPGIKKKSRCSCKRIRIRFQEDLEASGRWRISRECAGFRVLWMEYTFPFRNAADRSFWWGRAG